MYVLCAAVLSVSSAFVSPISPRASAVRVNGMFDFILDGFKNQDYDDRRARAKHILVKDEATIVAVKEKLDAGVSFSEAAKEFSTCPSAKSGGGLGSFEPGKMVAEFDAICFDDSVAVNEVVGPVKTQFGYHLIVVEERFINTDRSTGSSVF